MRWYREKWIDACVWPKRKSCGRTKATIKSKVTYCRPSKVVDKKTFFSKNSLNENIPTVGIFSRIEEQKGQHLVLDAINQYIDNIQLCIIGHAMDNEYKNRLLKDAADYNLTNNLRFIDVGYYII